MSDTSLHKLEHYTMSFVDCKAGKIKGKTSRAVVSSAGAGVCFDRPSTKVQHYITLQLFYADFGLP